MIEILIVLVIIFILAAVLTPAYQSYILRGNRSDAIKSLLLLQIAQEKYRLNNTTYGTLGNVWSGSASVDGYYTLSVPSNGNTNYTLTATAQGSQAADTNCASFTITFANGTQTNSSSPNTDCWSQ